MISQKQKRKEDLTDMCGEDENMTSDREAPELFVEHNKFYNTVQLAIRQLPERYRTCMYLNIVMDCNYRKI